MLSPNVDGEWRCSNDIEKMLRAPDGSTATYKAQRTREAYADPSLADNCDCAGCRNYRAAWNLEVFQPDLLAACIEMGIDPMRAFETTALGFERNLVVYTGEFPFYGTVSNEERFKKEFYPWMFRSGPTGTAAFSKGLATITFFVELPWVLFEPNPYA